MDTCGVIANFNEYDTVLYYMFVSITFTILLLGTYQWTEMVPPVIGPLYM